MKGVSFHVFKQHKYLVTLTLEKVFMCVWLRTNSSVNFAKKKSKNKPSERCRKKLFMKIHTMPI